jgi:hypothetical protein
MSRINKFDTVHIADGEIHTASTTASNHFFQNAKNEENVRCVTDTIVGNGK